MRGKPLILLAAAVAIGPAAAARDDGSRDAKRLAQALAGRAAGPPQRCLSSFQLGSPETVGRTLLYRDGRTIWRNDIPDCPSLASDPILVVEIYGGQLCENEQFHTVERGGIGIPGPFCRFGPFVPYRKPR